MIAYMRMQNCVREHYAQIFTSYRNEAVLEIKKLLTVLVDGDLDIVNDFTFLVLLFLRPWFIVPAEEYGAPGKSCLLYALLFCTLWILRPPENDAFRCGEGRSAFSAGVPVAVN